MSFPGYPEYKDSGVEWLGVVPAHWQVTSLKHDYSVLGGSTPKSEIADYWDGDVVWVTPADLSQLDSFEIHQSNRTITMEGLNSCGTTLVPAGSVVLSTRAPIGSLGIAATELCTNQGCKSLVPNNLQCSRYMAYVLSVLADELNIRGRGATFLELSSDELKSFKVGFPPEPEQKTIATFLDCEISKIDALIAEQEQLIALLKEKRQAVISHAVTKGLNPHVSMKDSGVKWLGQIPDQWSVKRLKFISPFITVGIVVNPSVYVSDEGLPFIYGGNIAEGAIDSENCRRISATDSDRNGKTKLRAGDLLTVRVGAPGITAVVTEECAGGNCASVMLTRKGDFDSDWLCYAMNSRMVRYQVEIVQYGAAQEQFNISHAKEFLVATPPRLEQEQIARYLRMTTAALEELAKQAQLAITLLQERRSAIISAAVTGKIDVRGSV